MAQAGVVHMSERSDEPAGLSDWCEADVGEPTGKPYEWQLARPESTEMIALVPGELVERALARAAAFNDVLVKAAAYFIVVSRINGYEGRDPLVVKDDFKCGAVCDFLGIDIDVLGRALLELHKRGIVTPLDDGNLLIDDINALDALSDRGRAGI